MDENFIKTNRGVYGRVNITLPLPAKLSMFAWMKKTGMKKSEFLRAALMIGALKLANDLKAKNPNEGYFENQESDAAAQQPART